MRIALVFSTLVCVSVAAFGATSCTKVTPSSGLYVPISEELQADNSYKQAQVDMAGCPAAASAGCGQVQAQMQKDLLALSKVVFPTVVQLNTCASNSADDQQKAWYTTRAMLWYGLQQDLTARADAVTSGTYRFSPTFVAGYLGLPAAQSPTVTTCPDSMQPTQIDIAEQLIQAWPVQDCGLHGDKSKCMASAQQLRNAVTTAVQILKYCEAHPPQSGAYDKAWYTQEAVDWEPLDLDMTDHAQQIVDGSYQLPESWKAPVHPAPSAFAASPYVRALLGGTYSAASGTDPQGKLLADVFVDLPFIGSKQIAHADDSNDTDNKKCKAANSKIKSIRSLFQAGAWGYARVGSIGDPKSIVQSSQIATQFVSQLNGTPSQVVQSFEMNAGMFIQWNLHPDIDMFDRVAIDAIVGGGALTPVSPGQAQPAYFEATPAVEEAYKKPPYDAVFTSCGTATNPDGSYQNCYLQLYNQDRSRFFRTYEGGVRLKAYLKPDIKQASAFPAMFDVTFGQNEYVTGGKFTGAVMHLGGSAPVLATGLYIFGSMDVGIHNRSDSTGPILIPANPAISTTTVVVPVAVAPYNRDRYSIGFGIDVLQLIRNHSMQDALSAAH